MRRWILGMSAVVATTALVLACSVGNDCDFGLCAGAAVGSDGGDGDTGGADVAVKPPEGCDEKADPKDSLPCVVSEFGIFVAPSGKPGASGKKEDPVNSITAALAKTSAIRRIYVCEGSFDERVVLKSAISIYGGFKCADWSYGGTKAIVGKAQEPGYALDVQSVPGSFEIVDLEFVAAPGTEASPNSIAARFVGTAGAVLRRMKLTARDGAAGKNGDVGAAGSTVKHTDFAGTPNFDPNGVAGSTAAPGGSKTCKCPNAPSTELTVGGAGGAPGTGAGQKGDPAALPPTGLNDGAGGAASAVNCGVGDGTGHDGATRAQASGGTVPTSLGEVDGNDWKPRAGAPGTVGLPGQGGGGGSGQTASGGGAGSGGGCGGCGGFGGTPGTGGGASVALLTIASPIRFGGELVAATGGKGGDGGDGGNGGNGGAGGVHTSGTGCGGGNGGDGGKGGAASGSAGGLSVGVLSSGAAPVTDGTTFSLGKAGDGGDGKASNPGPKGVKANTATIEALSTKTTL